MKRFFTLLSLSLFLFSVSFSDVIMEPEMFDEVQNEESNDLTTTSIKDEENIVANVEDTKVNKNIQIPSAQTDTNKSADGGLNSIGFGFCNEGEDNLSTNLNYAVNIGQPFKVCTVFFNESESDVTLKVRLMDGDTTAQGSKTCNPDSINIQKFIDSGDLAELETITIPAGQRVVKQFDITFPIGLEGTQSACFTYYTPSSVDPNAMVSTIINKVSFMDFFIGELGDIKNEVVANNIETFLDENKELNLSFLLQNVGNLENSMIISGQISNIFGFKRDFTFDGGELKLNAGGETPITIKLGSIPNYGGLFNINISVTATPFFSYDISQSNIDPTLLEDKVFNITTTYFQMPWLILIVLVLVIVILFLAFRKPKNKAQPQVVYVQVPQQPTQPTAQPQQPQIPQQ